MPKRSRESNEDDKNEQSSNKSRSISSNSSNSSSKSIKQSNSPSSESSDNEHQNDNQSIDAIEDSKTRSETLRKRQHQKSDKQRRAKIKEGMDQLKTLVSMHGKLESPDQASIVTASIDLVHSLRNEIVSLKRQIDAAQASNVQQRAAIQQFQSRMSIYNPPFSTPTHQLFSESPLDLPIPPAQAPIKRSSSVVSNSSGIVSNAQFAQLSAQIQQIRPYNHNNNNNNSNNNNQQQQQQQQQMQSPQLQSQQHQQQNQQQFTPSQLQRLASVLGFPNNMGSHQGDINSILDGSPLPQMSPSMSSQMSHQQHNYNPQNSPQAPRPPWDQ